LVILIILGDPQPEDAPCCGDRDPTQHGSKGTCLKIFYDFFDSLVKFFENKDGSLRENVLKFKNDIANLTDLYNKFNVTNLQLQGDDSNLIKAKTMISAFESKLVLYKQNLGRRQFYQFPNLSSVETNDDDILVILAAFGST
jgi:hypothetical protein